MSEPRKLTALQRHLQEVLIHERFNVGQQNRYRLKESLRMTGCRHLDGVTLLTPSVHKIHAYELNERYQRKWEKILARERRKDDLILKSGDIPFGFTKRSAHDIADSTVRFLTLIDSVLPMSESEGLNAARILKQELELVIKQVPDVACLGALEIEVISLKHMRRVHKLKADSDFPELDDDIDIDQSRLDNLLESRAEDERSKLEVCEILGAYLDETLFSGERGQLLVHFHGVITASSSKAFDQLDRLLKSHPRWSQCTKQVRLENFSRTYDEIEKPTSISLKHIATYITKGGNDWQGGRAYLKYKLSFKQSMPLDIDEWYALNWRDEQVARIEHIEEGITDVLSLTRFETSVLAKCIHGMMNWNTRGTGYLLTVGRW